MSLEWMRARLREREAEERERAAELDGQLAFTTSSPEMKVWTVAPHMPKVPFAEDRASELR